MKVLYILHSTIMGGATISFLNMVEGLITCGVNAAVAIPNHDEELENKLKQIGATFKVVPIVTSIFPAENSDRHLGSNWFIKKMWSLKKEVKKFVSFLALSLLIKKEKPDIIHTNTGVVHEGFKCARMFSIPHVWHLREYQDKDFHWQIYPSKEKFEKKLSLSYVITITNDILRYFHLESCQKARTVYNGIMHASDCYQDWPKQSYFLCASRISPEKGHEDTIRAFSEFYKSHNDYKLLMLGFGSCEYVNYLKQLSAELKCSEAVEWLGFKSDVREYMRYAKALIVASRFEGFGRMTAEACFCGCPVVGRDSGGTREILSKTGGILFYDIKGLVNKMNEISVLDETQYVCLSKHAQKVAIDLYSIESNIDQIYRFYQQILKDSVA